ncbi:MAG: phosphoadenylyl-sulfate reductase [Corynebacterium sp.]|uniref:phosphoadenylyl-sulfate reductase n=1 Tax=Corynebacterium sp. TaxID=1720 RepID=UPI0026DBD0FB|nr:phosphoadenylyl-sulfate reductase [Corynebacterium sp.]MDO4760582.1 phosphoadenylyl-sulfate reductase [Corynebacterium sp.]
MNLLPRIDYADPLVSPTQPPLVSLDEQTKTRNKYLVERDSNQLYNADASTIFNWARENIGAPIVVTLSMENTVLAELASTHLPEADFLFLETGYHFPETLEVAAKVEKRYPNTLLRSVPVLSVSEQNRTYGPSLYRTNPTACCRMRKVEPLAASLSNYAAWVTGLRRADGPTRATTPAIELDAQGRIKINPLVTWTLEETETYIRTHNLIRHPLTDQGYLSIGCATCTLPVAEGQDPRAGRWAGSTKTECGLHL